MLYNNLQATKNPIKKMFLFLLYFCWNCALFLDLAVNFWPLLGDPQETISSRAGKGKLRGALLWVWAAKIIDYLALNLFNDTNHCVKNIHNDTGYHQLYKFSGIPSLFNWLTSAILTGFFVYWFMRGAIYVMDLMCEAFFYALSFLSRLIDTIFFLLGFL